MLRFATTNLDSSRRISAHRQTWMNSDALDMTPASKVQTEQNIRNTDHQQASRYRDDYAAQRASITIYELIDAENVRARKIAALVDAGDVESAVSAASAEAPIAVINELLLQSTIPISISIRENERLMASKNGGPEYSAAELSDGERNAVLIAGNVLTAPSDSLLIIDEPERHLHRSIISPLLSQLFARRPDCGFVISTHDHDLPLSTSEASVLLLRSCEFSGDHVQSWEADLVRQDTPIDDELKRDLIGARRRVLFVEGSESSLDKALYSLIFPMASVIPKGSRREVERVVAGARAGESFHWLRAFGVVDGDGYQTEQGSSVQSSTGLYPLPVYAVEAIYYHPQVIEKVARRQAAVRGDESSDLTSGALAAGAASIRGHTERLSRTASKKAIREHIFSHIPNDDALLRGERVIVPNRAKEILAERRRELDDAVDNGDWEVLVTRCPVRESPALGAIATALGFRSRAEYERAVRHLLASDDEALALVRGLFGDLFESLSENQSQSRLDQPISGGDSESASSRLAL